MFRIDEAMAALKPGEHLSDTMPCPWCAQTQDDDDDYCEACDNTRTVTRAEALGYEQEQALWAALDRHNR